MGLVTLGLLLVSPSLIRADHGTLTYVEMQKDGVDGVDGLGDPYSVTVSPDGKHVYATSDYDDTIAVFPGTLPQALLLSLRCMRTVWTVWTVLGVPTQQR